MKYRELGSLSPLQKKQFTDFVHPTVIPPLLDTMLAAVQYPNRTSSENNKVEKVDYRDRYVDMLYV
tara:strand:- start:113 stop:310 length:198 start_codon:yes stop_codon:yes gene_type:complete